MNLHVHANFGPCAPLSSHTPCYLASPPVLLQLKLLACTGRAESDSAAFAALARSCLQPSVRFTGSGCYPESYTTRGHRKEKEGEPRLQEENAIAVVLDKVADEAVFKSRRQTVSYAHAGCAG
jgi:hypothetical protein